jgi:hypothetical protein
MHAFEDKRSYSILKEDHSQLSSLTSGLSQTLVLNHWMTSRLVHIHKEDKKKKASNYMTIITASIFAKVLGGLLEGKLTK